MKGVDVRWKQRYENYKKALQQLEQAVGVKNPDLLQKQGIIQCFEYTFELAWKTLQDFLSEVKGYENIRGPKPVLEQAFQDGMIENGVEWMNMLQSRNLTSHLYDETAVQKILEKILHPYFGLFKALGNFFEKGTLE